MKKFCRIRAPEFHLLKVRKPQSIKDTNNTFDANMTVSSFGLTAASTINV